MNKLMLLHFLMGKSFPSIKKRVDAFYLMYTLNMAELSYISACGHTNQHFTSLITNYPP